MEDWERDWYDEDDEIEDSGWELLLLGTVLDAESRRPRKVLPVSITI